MSRDPIVEEVRAARDKFAREHNYDVHEIVRALRKASVDNGRTVVSLVPQKLPDPNGGTKSG